MSVTTKLTLGAFLLLLTLSVIFIPRVLRVGSIVCVSQFGPCSGILLEKLNKLGGKPIGEVRREIA